MRRSPSIEPGLRAIEELLVDVRGIPLWVHPEWAEQFPWLVQGTTGKGTGTVEEAVDFGLFGEVPVGRALARWRDLREGLGMASTAHARQVHGSEIHAWTNAVPSGFLLVDSIDGHCTSLPGLLLTVSLADCVPVFLVAEGSREIALVHAGWRGTARGVLEAAIEAMIRRSGRSASSLWVHCGPAICGECYEVGPEVHAAILPDRPLPERPTPIDVRQALVRRATSLGVLEERTTISAHCTLCGPSPFFSHRAGESGRQLGILGRRD